MIAVLAVLLAAVQTTVPPTRTIDRGHERRTIDLLLKMRVDNSRNCGNAPL